jgi:hypothetical protein
MLMRLQHKRPDGEVDTYHLKPGRKYHLGRGSTCEIRILDLKLSRKHCVIEHVASGWQVEDLGSTNGCKLDGKQLVGTAPLRTGASIEAGSTTVTVAGLVDPSRESPEADAAAAPEQMPATSETGDGAPFAESTMIANDWEPKAHDQQAAQAGALQKLGDGPRATPVLPSPKHPTPAVGIDDPFTSVTSSTASNAPHTQISNTSALAPRQPTPVPATPAASPSGDRPRIKPITIRVGKIDGGDRAPAPVDELRLDDDVPAPQRAPAVEPVKPITIHTGPTPVKPVVIQSAPVAATPVAATPAPATPAASPEERPFFITVLGRRVGPLNRAAARELKARELKGTLTTADLDTYPQG